MFVPWVSECSRWKPRSLDPFCSILPALSKRRSRRSESSQRSMSTYVACSFHLPRSKPQALVREEQSDHWTRTGLLDSAPSAEASVRPAWIGYFKNLNARRCPLGSNSSSDEERRWADATARPEAPVWTRERPGRADAVKRQRRPGRGAVTVPELETRERWRIRQTPNAILRKRGVSKRSDRSVSLKSRLS